MRLVLDSNVVASALLWGGTPETLLHAARQQRVTLYSSPILLAELAEILERNKFAKALRRIGSTPAQLAGDYRALTRVVRPLYVPRVIAGDPDDDHVIACAIAASADAIVSGDKHLIALRPDYQGIAILTPKQAMEQVGVGGDR
jgi:putative PIN family toxin of toxin-antitoxin system